MPTKSDALLLTPVHCSDLSLILTFFFTSIKWFVDLHFYAVWLLLYKSEWINIQVKFHRFPSISTTSQELSGSNQCIHQPKYPVTQVLEEKPFPNILQNGYLPWLCVKYWLYDIQFCVFYLKNSLNYASTKSLLQYFFNFKKQVYFPC